MGRTDGKTAALGDLARDDVTGFEGIVMAETKWLNGCVRLTLQPQKVGKDNKVVEAQTFDTEQVSVVKAKVLPPPPVQHGGPAPEPARRRDPSR